MKVRVELGPNALVRFGGTKTRGPGVFEMELNDRELEEVKTEGRHWKRRTDMRLVDEPTENEDITEDDFLEDQ